MGAATGREGLGPSAAHAASTAAAARAAPLLAMPRPGNDRDQAEAAGGGAPAAGLAAGGVHATAVAAAPRAAALNSTRRERERGGDFFFQKIQFERKQAGIEPPAWARGLGAGVTDGREEEDRPSRPCKGARRGKI